MGAVRTRGLIGIVAMLGVLLHAAILVRHHGLMLNAQLQYQGLSADLKVICHGSVTPDETELPNLPRPASTDYDCPVCSGLVGAFALAAVELGTIPRPISITHDFHAEQSTAQPAHRRDLPPARGPPALG